MILNNKKIIFILMIMIITVLIVGCEIGGASSNEDGDLPKLDYVIMVNSDISLPLTNFNTLNPIYSDNFYYYHFSKLVFESLFTYDENFRIKPQLAYDWNISENGRSIIITLKDDVYWHDGKNLTSDDVIYTINTLKRAGNNSIYYKVLASVTSNVADINLISAKKIDDYSLEILVNKDINFALDILTFPIISSTLGDGGLAIDNYKVIGTGPYKFIEYIKFKEIKLEAYDQYREGEPEIKYISGKIFEDEKLILTAFETGKLSVSGSIGVDWDKYVHNPRVDIKEYVTADYDAIAFNHDNPYFQGDNGTILKKSIMYALDRQEMISKIYLGHGTQTDTPLHPDHYLTSPESNLYGFIPQRSRELMDTMIFTEEDPLKSEDYENIRLRLLVNPNNQYRVKVAEAIKFGLDGIGIGIDIDKANGTDSSSYLAKLTTGDFDMAIVSWKQSVLPIFDYLFFQENIGTTNIGRFVDEDFESIITQTKVYSNEQDKLEIFKDLQISFAEKLPYGILMYRNRALLIDSNIKGDLSPNFFNLYDGLNKCYLIMRTD